MNISHLILDHMCVICDQPYNIVESINDAEIQRGYQLETSSSEKFKMLSYIYSLRNFVPSS